MNSPNRHNTLTPPAGPAVLPGGSTVTGGAGLSSKKRRVAVVDFEQESDVAEEPRPASHPTGDAGLDLSPGARAHLAKREVFTALCSTMRDQRARGWTLKDIKADALETRHDPELVELAIRELREAEALAKKTAGKARKKATRPEVTTAPPPEWQPPEESGTEAPDKPRVALPAGERTITDAAGDLGKLLSDRLAVFNRGGAIVRLTTDATGKPELQDVKPAAMASDFETVARLVKHTQDGDLPTHCAENTARLIMHAQAFRDTLPPLSTLAPCPVLTEHTGELVEVTGYHRASGIYATGKPPEVMPLPEAMRLLVETLAGFRFATPADRSRAIAALLTPALTFGGLLPGRAPVDLGEADESQSGKGYRSKITTAIYGQGPRTITQGNRGVGGLEEAFSTALIRGAQFILFDNVRGRVDSQAFESFLTEDHFTARAAYSQAVDIDPRRVVIMMTSNRADLTKDLANRCACVRILKQPDGHLFARYPEGDVLEHVRANQSRYLGAVFAIVRAWHAAGKPRTNETRHDFRGWAQVLDWIVQEIFAAPPLIDGHRETQCRMTNPALSWLRDVALEAIRAKQAGAWLRASDLAELLSETEIETPGLPEHGDMSDADTRKAALQAIGRKLGVCFRAGDLVTIDGMVIERREEFDPERAKPVREYRFTPPPMDETEPRALGPRAIRAAGTR